MDIVGAVLSAFDVFFLVIGILQAGNNSVRFVIFLAVPSSCGSSSVSVLESSTARSRWRPCADGLGLGVMLTPSVNVVQSSFPEAKQGEISGLSRSVSNLGSSLGTAIAGTILVSELASGNRSYVLAMVVLAGMVLIGLVAAMFLPSDIAPAPE